MMCAIYYGEPKEASKSISQCSKPTCAKYRTHGLYVAPPPSLAARGLQVYSYAQVVQLDHIQRQQVFHGQLFLQSAGVR